MNRKKWICTAAAITGLLLAVIAGLSIRHMKNSSYVSASELAGQKSGLVSEKLEENGNEDLAESSESKNGQPDGKQDQENGVGAEKNQNGGNSSAGQNTDEEAAENDSSTGESENDSQESKAESEAEPTDQPVKLVFSGDILLSDHVMNAYKNGGIRSVLDSQFQSVIDESDIFMANEEFPFSTRGTPAEDKQFTFRAAPSLTFVFKELGIDIVTLANNHAMDYGTDALLDTCDTLDKAGIRRVGAGKNLDEAKAPVILEAQGKKIGFLGASRVIPVASWNATSTKPGMLTTYDPKILVDEIKKRREQCDYLVVYVHWVIERSERPEDYQRSLGKQYIDAGADVVIGSHPHVLQGVEYYKGKPIVYSLGNFIFGSSIPKTALLKVQWDGQASQLTFVPGTSSAGYTRVLENEAQKADFASYMTGISYGVTIEDDGTVVPQG